MHGTVWYPFCLAWSSITCFRSENVSYKRLLHVSGIKSQPYLDYFQNTPNGKQTSEVMNVHTKWNCMIPILSSITCFSSENASCKRPLHVSGKITALPRLFSEYTYQNHRALRAILIFPRLIKPVSKLDWLWWCVFWSDFIVKCWQNEVVPGLGGNLSSLVAVLYKRVPTSLRLHTTSSGKRLLKVSECFCVLIRVVSLL